MDIFLLLQWGCCLLVLRCALAAPLEAAPTAAAASTAASAPPVAATAPVAAPAATAGPGAAPTLPPPALAVPTVPYLTEAILQQPADDFLTVHKNQTMAASHVDATYLQSLYWDFNGTFHLSKFDDFDHTAIDELNEIRATTLAPPWLPKGPDKGKTPKELPQFDSNLVTNVTVQLGESAFLRCKVRNLGEHKVMWIRRRDWHILTSGTTTYTTDERYEVVHPEAADEWHLVIRYVQKRDNGTYECQVPTGAGKMSHYFNLHVMVPAAFILGSGEYHIGEGSTISLVCIIENSPVPPQYVMWYHNGRMINYDTVRGGVTVSTEPGPKTHSRLVVNSATHGDSGNYTCRASNTEEDTIYVSVSNEGDNTAAIQGQGTSFTSRVAGLPFPFSVLMALLSAWRSASACS